MPRAEWGKKIVCPECSTKFYDLNKKYPIECPGCGVFIALNEMLQYGSDAKKVHDDNLDSEEVGNLVGDDAKFNSDKILNIFQGEDNDFSKAVCLNAAAGLIVSEKYDDFNIAYNYTRGFIKSGAAFKYVKNIQNV